jgi:ABC-type multidrug transport system fused ATPase/permease subunit
VRDSGFVILDEATSALDTETEQVIQQSLDRLFQHRTCLVIAHRLSTVQRADLIVLMEQGRIIEQGTHDTLIARSGRYARLHAGQFARKTPFIATEPAADGAAEIAVTRPARKIKLPGL